MEIVRIGPELAKYVLEVDVRDGVVLPRFLRREAVARFISELPPLVVGMEACFGPRYWSKAFYQVSDVVGFG